MQTDENLIRQVIQLFEEKTGWGDSEKWTNQDFLQLSELIRDHTGETISHVTLKRIWGKVKYDSLPNTHTLNTLVQYLGFDNWRDFTIRQTTAADRTPSPNPTQNRTVTPNPTQNQSITPDPSQTNPPPPIQTTTPTPPAKITPTPKRKKLWLLAPLLAIPLLFLLLHGQKTPPMPQDYVFTSKKVVTSGLPNSVIFDYDASRSPEDSVIIQQSWDTTRRVKVSKKDHQHTSIYYYPDFYHATLQVQNHTVKTHSLLIGTNGWLPLIEQSPVPVYFKPEAAIHDGKISLTVDQVKHNNIPLQPNPPTIMITNVRDYGEIYTDHFTFETALKNDYSEGSAVCQLSRIYLLCEGTAIWVPLCAKGCVSNVDLYFTYYYTDGKREDLSAFGVPNFNDYVKLRIESDSGRAKILINDKLAYTVNRHIIRSKIIGIMYRFQGAGSVDYTSLSNGKFSYREDFNQ